MGDISLKKIEEVTQRDIDVVIKRWNKDEGYSEWKKCESKEYDLKVDGEIYPSKPIFALAYDKHHKENHKPSDWESYGGISKKRCVAIQLRDRLGFEIVSKKEQNDYSLWKKISENVLIRRGDKLFFKDNGFYISKDIEKFFDAENMECGERKDIQFHYLGESSLWKIEKIFPECCRVSWKAKSKFGNYIKEYYKRISEHTSIRFQKNSEGEYEIKLFDSQIVGDIVDKPYETIIPQKEGKKKEFFVTRYERDSANREKAIEIHGMKCVICEFDFEEVYGEAGRNYIEVHHIKPLAEVKEEVEVNPKTDLVCVCANCHSIIHRKQDKIYSIEEMKAMIGNRIIGIKDRKDD